MDPHILALLFFGIACLVLARYQQALVMARDEREADLIEQLAQPCEWMSQPVASSKSTLQPVDGLAGSGLVGAALAAHESKFVEPRESRIGQTQANGVQIL